MNLQDAIDSIQMFFQHSIEVERVKNYLSKKLPQESHIFIDFIREIDFHACRFNDKRESKELGAYYTPSTIVNYLTRELLLLKLIELTTVQIQKNTKHKTELWIPIIQHFIQIKHEMIQNHHFDIKEFINLIQNKISPDFLEQTIIYVLNALISIKIIDPSCGTGNFLLEMMYLKAELYLQLYQLNLKLNSKAVHYQIKQEIVFSKNCFGIDIDPFAIKTARFRLYLLERILQEQLQNSVWETQNSRYLILQIIEDDILKSQDRARFKDFDIVIGNPPYINLIESCDFRLILEKRFPAIYHGKLDFSYYFIPIAMELINKRGIIGFVMKRYFLKSAVARNLRKYIKLNAVVREIIDFGKNKVFKGTGIDTLLITFESIHTIDNSNSATPVYYITQSISHDKPLETILRLQSTLQIPNMADRWLLDRENMPIYFEKSLKNYTLQDFLRNITIDENSKEQSISKIELNSKQLETRLFKLVKGIQTGKDDVFVVDVGIPLESEKTRVFLKGQHIMAYNILPSHLKLILSHQYSRIFQERRRSGAKYPLIEKYLFQHREQLINRSRAKGEDWSLWRKGDERNSIDFTIPKLIWPYRGENFYVARDSFGCYHSQDIILFTLNGKELIYTLPNDLYQQILTLWNEEISYFYLGILNSRIFKAYLYPYAKEFAFHTKDFQPNNFQDLPLPLMMPQDLLHQEIVKKSKLAEKLIHSSGKDKEFTNILREIDDLTQKIFTKRE